MPFFRVVAAKNNQKVELTAKFDTEIIARESLHKQGYSIIEIRETEAPEEIVSKTGSVFYFEINLSWQKKTGQIHSDDIFKAYKKLVDDLGYTVVSITTSPDASEEEKIYTTAKTKESYDEFKKRKEPTEVSVEVAAQTQKNKLENEDENSFLVKEVRKYQLIISTVYLKLEKLIDTYSSLLSEERVIKIKELLPVLRQMRQATNIDKLRIVGEAALIRIGELEMEILSENKNIEKWSFFKETNSLLKELWSSKRVGNDFTAVKKKILQFFHDFKGEELVEKEWDKIEKKIDTSSFVYYKNLRELSLYKERLKEVNRAILKSLFSDSKKRMRLVLKKKLIKQNISIIESRITKKRFSYTKIIKGVMYYEEVFTYLVRSISDIILYSFLILITLFSGLSFSNEVIMDRLSQIVFLWSILGIFVVIFGKIKSFLGIWIGFGIFFLVSFALRINF